MVVAVTEAVLLAEFGSGVADAAVAVSVTAPRPVNRIGLSASWSTIDCRDPNDDAVHVTTRGASGSFPRGGVVQLTPTGAFTPSPPNSQNPPPPYQLSVTVTFCATDGPL